ncbi:hypothetical protein FMUND_9450 [Fusarium mundagurra]|uniref:LysM domain-containing protein n=1 Tax=Fusarium mundagurra TaxID=1567541 RepID=A0A8H5YE68_9HYPO|nr:hypothetical protein FMUND_9450 [Fusarium mundagurra]
MIQLGMTTSCNKFHEIKKTTTCASIQDYYKVTMEQIAKWNTAVGSKCTALWAGYSVCWNYSFLFPPPLLGSSGFRKELSRLWYPTKPFSTRDLLWLFFIIIIIIIIIDSEYTPKFLHLLDAHMGSLSQPRFPRNGGALKFLECPFHKYNSIQFFKCAGQPLMTMRCVWDHLKSMHLASARPNTWTCHKCREDIIDEEGNTRHNVFQCVKTDAGESGILLVSELKQYREAARCQRPEIAWHNLYSSIYPNTETPRTHLVEIAVPYLTAKAQATRHPTGYWTLPYDTIYATAMSSGEYGLETSQQAASSSSSTVHHPPNMQLPYSGYQAQQQQMNFQQLPRQSPSLYAPQNDTQSQQQRVNPQQALQQAPHSHLPAFGTPNPQPQGSSTMNGFSISHDSPWPDTMSGDSPNTQLRSLGQQNLDIAQPQQEEDPRVNWQLWRNFNPDNHI